MKSLATLVLSLLLLAALAPATLAQDDGRIEWMLRDVAAHEISNGYGQGSPTPTPAFGGEKLGRVKQGLWSLIIPGWSQYRAGHRGRAAIFGGAELAIWTSYAVFKLQGNRREDSYQDYAQQFAEVQGTDHDDDYWRAVASYESSEDYNDDVRRDLRADLEPDGPLYEGADAWSWQSEQRFSDYQTLRASSLDALDRATFVTVFALVNRVIAFVDAVRSGVDEVTDLEAEAAGFRVTLDVDPDLRDPGTTVSLHRSF